MPTEPDLPQASAPVAAHLRPRRNPRMVAAGVLLSCLGGLGGFALLEQSTHSQQVIVVARDVARGEKITGADLGVVTMGQAPGVRTLPADRLDELVGRQALVDLPRGSLVGDGSIGEAQLAKGSAQIGLKLATGRLPVAALPAGTPVQLVQVTSDAGRGLVVDAVVVTAPSSAGDGTSRVLDVAVDEGKAAQVADLAARDLLVVVRKAG